MRKYSRECLALQAGFSLKGGDVAAVLEQLKRIGRKPKTITVDNGSEFTSRELDTWGYLNDVKLDFIRPGKPGENCYIESFNGKLRDECLNMNPLHRWSRLWLTGCTTTTTSDPTGHWEECRQVTEANR